MLNLPMELLQRIFIAAHSTAIRCSAHNPPSAFNIEIILGCVCRYWREVVHDTPGLWTVISLSPVQSSFCLMEVYISRSRSLPISLRVDFGRADADFSVVWDLYQTIVGRVSRLSIWHLEMGPSYLDFWHRSNAIMLPTLKILVIPCMAPNILFEFFEAIHAPALETVAISISTPARPQYTPVDVLYLAYEVLNPHANFDVPDSFANLFPQVRHLGLIGTPRWTLPQTLFCAIIRLARIFPNIICLYTDVRISAVHSIFDASTQSLWPNLHYISFLQDVSTSTTRTIALALQESRVRNGQPIHTINLAGTGQPTCLSSARERAQDVQISWW